MIRTDLINLPDSITAASSQAAILDALGPQVVNRLLGNHGGWEECLAEAGHQMEPLKFPGVIWMIGTGENHSGNLVSGRKRSMITPEITAEFTLSRPSAITALRANAGLKAAQLRRKVEGLTQR